MNYPLHKSELATLAAAAALLIPPSILAEPVARKFIGTGWDTLRISPEEVLANAPAFADSGLDGINLCFETRDAVGLKGHRLFFGLDICALESFISPLDETMRTLLRTRRIAPAVYRKVCRENQIKLLGLD